MNLFSAHRADVHSFPAARRLDHGVEALGGAEENLGLLHVVLLLGLQRRLHVLLLPTLQELQLLNRWTMMKTDRKSKVIRCSCGAKIFRS